MISNHYPMTYGADRPWLVLALLGLTGVAVRHVFNLRHRAMPTGRAIALATLMALVSVSYVTFEKGVRTFAADITYVQAAPILKKHCADCHSATPTHPEFPSPPMGVMLDSYDKARAAAPRIKAVTVDSDVMPLGNITGMTEEERETIGAWIAAGAPR